MIRIIDCIFSIYFVFLSTSDKRFFQSSDIPFYTLYKLLSLMNFRLFCIGGMLLLSIVLRADHHVVSYELIRSYSVEDLKQEWKKNEIPKFVVPIKDGIDVYEIIYRSTWIDGEEIKASGLYFVPQDKSVEHPILSYQHGTDTKRERILGKKSEHIIGLIFATDGYAVSMPDYFGLGKSDKTHLFTHADSEATACIDMLRALKEVNQEIDVKTNDQLFLTGYSQGGHATMAMHQKIQEELSQEFTVTASSPMSGPFDLYKSQDPIMFEANGRPTFLPYLIISYQIAYNFYPGNIAEVFKEEYQDFIVELYNGDLDFMDIDAQLPRRPIDVLKDSLLHEYKNNPEFIFTRLLKKNSNYDWKPEAPVQLCYCENDNIVKSESSKLAYKTMKANGAENVTLRQAGRRFDHIKCAGFTMLYTKMYLDSFRKGSKKGRKGPIMKRLLLGVARGFVDAKLD